VFDFVVISLAFAPDVRDHVTLLRLVRLLRVVRLVSVLPELRLLIGAMARSLRPILSLLYGMVGWILFEEEDPGQLGQHRPGAAEPVSDPHARELAGVPGDGPGDRARVVDLLRRLHPHRLVRRDQHPDRDHHQLARGGLRARALQGARRVEDELAGDGSIADRLAEIRHALDKFETQLAESKGSLPPDRR
jgi:hypothetical protein